MSRSPRLLAAFFTFAGTMHFVRPRAYEAIVPAYIPSRPREAVRWSAAYAEIAGGLAAARSARPAGFARWWLLGRAGRGLPGQPPHGATSPRRSRRAASPPTGSRAGCSGRGCRCSRCSILWVWRATASRQIRRMRRCAGCRRNVRCASIRATGCPPRRAGRRGRRPRPALPRRALRASSISAIASSTGSRSATARRPPATIGLERAGAPRRRRSPARARRAPPPRARRRSIPYSAANSLARLGRRERDGQRLAADPQLAGGAVERRERELLRGLLDALRARATRAGAHGSATGGRLVAAAARGEIGDDERGRGARPRRAPIAAAHSAARARRRPLTARSSGGRARSGSAPRARTPAASRNEALNACVAARSTWSSIASRSAIVAARSPGIVGKRLERRPEHRHLAALRVDPVRDPLGEVDLRVAVESRESSSAAVPACSASLALGLEIGGEDRRQHQQAGDDPGVAGGDRPAAVDRLRRATGERGLGQRREGEREPDADQRLRRAASAATRGASGSSAERGEAAGDQDRPAPRRARPTAGTRRASGAPASAARPASP